MFQTPQRGPQEPNVAGNADFGLYVVAIVRGSATDLQISTKKLTGFSENSKLCSSSMYQTYWMSIPSVKLKKRNDQVIL